MTEEIKSRSDLSAPLDEYRRQFKDLKDAGRDLTEGLGAAQINWSPGSGKWSIGQCLGHLNEVTTMYLDRLEEVIPHAHRSGLTGETGPYNVIERWFARQMEPPIKRRLRAPKKMRPGPQLDPEATFLSFLEIKDRAIEIIEQSNGLDMARTKIKNPLFSFVKMSAGSALAILAAHERRHLWQARQVRARPDFPND